MYFIGRREWNTLLEPLNELEDQIFAGDFYSRRILANLYANKLIVLNSQEKYDEAAYYGVQSVKHRTEDFLYYLNNYVSVLLHLDRTELAMKEMLDAFPVYKSSIDQARRVVFITNYCRCLNRQGLYTKSISMASRFLTEMKSNLFQFRWHYFFRTYLFSLLKLGYTDQIVKINRNLKLVDRERADGRNPHIRLLMLAAEYREIKLSKKEFVDKFDEMRTADPTNDEGLTFLIEMIEEDLTTFP
jgi:tetratricopeptide (TPR) repeat protein